MELPIIYVHDCNTTELHRCFFCIEYAELLQFCTVLLLHGYCLVIKGKLKPQWLFGGSGYLALEAWSGC